MFRQAVMYLRMIKFSHSIFALPFAFTSALLAAGGIPGYDEIIWIAVAMVGARSGAMGLNRIIDRKIDIQNPRTMAREVAAGKIGVKAAMAFSIISLGLMVYAAWRLNPLCLALSPVAIFFLALYSYTKRFTWAAHFFLGIAISGAPVGAWIAVTGTFDAQVMAIALAVVCWLAGFDILYALQDTNFDRTHGLYSIPARFGVRKSIAISRALHVLSWLLLIATGAMFSMQSFYWAGMVIVGGLFIYEHRLVRHDDLSKLNMAFFNMNGYISVTVFVFTLLDYMVI